MTTIEEFLQSIEVVKNDHENTLKHVASLQNSNRVLSQQIQNGEQETIQLTNSLNQLYSKHTELSMKRDEYEWNIMCITNEIDLLNKEVESNQKEMNEIKDQFQLMKTQYIDQLTTMANEKKEYSNYKLVCILM
jgi:uncharacterized coiled-coil DUF342 family protein